MKLKLWLLCTLFTFSACGAEAPFLPPLGDVEASAEPSPIDDPTLADPKNFHESRIAVPICGFYVIEAFPTPDGLAAQQRAVQAWNDLAGFDLFEIATDPKELIDIYVTRVLTLPDDRAGQVVRNLERDVEGEPCSWTIEIKIGHEGEWELWAHEIGHTLYFNHSGNPDSIMHPLPIGFIFTDELQDLLDEALDALNEEPEAEPSPFPVWDTPTDVITDPNVMMGDSSSD